jgi:hypothetical protein
MRTYLRNDADSGELRLVFTDFWNGQHERTEYRVLSSDGRPLRNRAEFDGTAARQHHLPGGAKWFVRSPDGSDLHFGTEQQAVVDVKIPCRREASKSGRARCELCTAASAPVS